MPKPGKPASNPFASVESMDQAAAVRPIAPNAMSKSGIQGAGRKRGISIVGAEDRLVRLPMNKATGLSVALHLVGPIALTVLSLLTLLILSWIMHFNFWDLFKPKSPPQDMEFTLVNDTQATRPDKPLFKGNHNQRAGGKQNTKQPLKAVEEPPKSSAASKAENAKEQPKVTAQPEQPAVQQPPQPKKPPEPKAKEEPPKPLLTPPVATPSKPKPPEPKADSTAKTQTASAAATSATSPQAASTGMSSAGSNSSTSASSNPQKGDATNPGVDVAEDADFGPFMADLERRIKRNWVPPRGAESRKVMLLFYLARDGRVVKIETKKSSGDLDADRAAIASVEASAPFMAFPPQVREDILPVEFTFDYNVLNPTNPKHALKW